MDKKTIDDIWPKDAPKPDSNKKLLAFMEQLLRECMKDPDVDPKFVKETLIKIVQGLRKEGKP